MMYLYFVCLKLIRGSVSAYWAVFTIAYKGTPNFRTIPSPSVGYIDRTTGTLYVYTFYVPLLLSKTTSSMTLQTALPSKTRSLPFGSARATSDKRLKTILLPRLKEPRTNTMSGAPYFYSWGTPCRSVHQDTDQRAGESTKTFVSWDATLLVHRLERRRSLCVHTSLSTHLPFRPKSSKETLIRFASSEVLRTARA